MQFSVRYIILFSLAICGVCAVFVSTLAVSLKETQEVNKLLDKKKNVLMAAGLVKSGEEVEASVIEERFAKFQPVVINLDTGEELPDVDPNTFDQRKAKKDPAQSEVAPENDAGINRVPKNGLVYKAMGDGGEVDMLIIPVEGYGLWSTLYGFLALEGDLNTIRGLAFYEHGETPGLGGEVDNPRWQALWPGRRAYNEAGNAAITVIKGPAKSVEEAPYEVDGLSGATITARGVSNMMKFWLGPEGFGPYIQNLQQKGAA